MFQWTCHSYKLIVLIVTARTGETLASGRFEMVLYIHCYEVCQLIICKVVCNCRQDSAALQLRETGGHCPSHGPAVQTPQPLIASLQSHTKQLIKSIAGPRGFLYKHTGGSLPLVHILSPRNLMLTVILIPTVYFQLF